MTGFNNQIVNPGGCPLKGYWTVIEDGGTPELLWSVSWLPSSTPSGTSIKVYARASDDRLALSNKQFVEAVNGVQLANVRGRYLEVRTALIRDGCDKNPYLESLTICRYSKTLSVLPLEDQGAVEGQDAVFRVIALGTEPMSYQWYCNGVPMPGGTGPELRVSSVDCLDNGKQYSVHVTDASGDKAYAGPATLRVFGRGISIPREGAAGIASVYPAEIKVEGAPNRVSSVEVVLHGLTHDRPDDLDILLVSPTGKKIMLMSDVGGDTPVRKVTIWFKHDYQEPPDEGPLYSESNHYFTNANYGDVEETSFPPAPDNALNPPAGPYRDTLRDLIGINPNGVWRLYIMDDTGGKVGYISESWCLILHP